MPLPPLRMMMMIYFGRSCVAAAVASGGAQSEAADGAQRPSERAWLPPLRLMASWIRLDCGVELNR